MGIVAWHGRLDRVARLNTSDLSRTADPASR
jgi:hypothetical protein